MRTHKITYGADAVLPAYPGDTCRVPFTAEEEIQADIDEQSAAISREGRESAAAQTAALDRKIEDGSILFSELVELLQLRAGYADS